MTGEGASFRQPVAGEDDAVVLDAVDKRFGETVALSGASLRVDRGEVVGLIGANGAGKTTLIRVLLGLLAADAGRVRLLGRPPTREGRRRVGYVPQALGLWPDMTVGAHVDLAAVAYGIRPDRGTTGVLRDVTGEAGGRLVRDLPLGLRRRAAFAIALAHAPDVVVLDEPTSGVDPLARTRLWELVRGAADDGAGVLVSTHYLDEAEQCDRVVLLADGRVVADGTVDAVVDGAGAVEIRADDWRGAWKALDAAGVPVLPSGRVLRVPGHADEGARDVLRSAGVDATAEAVPATLEEVFLAHALRTGST